MVARVLLVVARVLWVVAMVPGAVPRVLLGSC